jgi:membrane protease YdiL (CAAX protease family)
MSKRTCESFKSATVVALVSLIAFLIVKYVGMQGNFKGNLACFFISTSYVLSLYLIPSKIRRLQRENPAHIKYRMLAASSSTIISCLISYQFYESWKFPTDINFFQACGIRLDGAFNVVSVTCLLMSIFYMGPLLSSFIYFHISFPQGVNGEGMIRFPKKYGKETTVLKYILKTIKSYRDDYGDLIIFRNLIFAPISEEVAFRALMIPALYSIYCLSELNKVSSNTSVLMINSGSSNNDSVRDSIFLYVGKYIHISPVFTKFLWYITHFQILPVLHPESCWKVVLRCPIWFVVAHIHHCVEKIRSGFTVLQALTGTLFFYSIPD